MAKNKNSSFRKKIIIICTILLLIGVAFAISEVQKQQNIRQEAAYMRKPLPRIAPKPTITPEPCGGIAGAKCKEGYYCYYPNGNQGDQAGYCVLSNKYKIN